MTRASVLAAVLGAMLLPEPGAAQGDGWLPGSAIPFVTAAVAARTGRDAVLDTTRWQAEARGLIRFASVVDHSAGRTERIIRADELHVEVYGGWPSGGKQVIRGWRDTSFQANSIVYHRDHLGIVSNDFGAVLRLGEGDEVRDVPHPLSPAGVDHYLFRVGDTITIAAAGNPVRVVAVEVRPRVPEDPGTVGVMHIDPDRGALVSFRFTFTRSSYRDATVSDIAVELENSFLEGTLWLPIRQSIAIRRSLPLVALPVHTVLRADWEITGYRFGRDSAAALPPSAPAIGGLRRPGGDVAWQGRIVDRLEGMPSTEEERDRWRRHAEGLVGRDLLDGMPGLRLLGDGLSSWLGADRVQGVHLGGAVTVRAGGGTELGIRLGIGTSSGEVTGGVSLRGGGSRVIWEVGADRKVVDRGDRFPGSLLANSLATVARGLDAGDWHLRDRLHAGIGYRDGDRRAGLDIGIERTSSMTAVFGGVGGEPESNPSLGFGEATVARLSFADLSPRGTGWELEVEGATGDAGWVRGAVHLAFGGVAGTELSARAVAGGDGTPPARWMVLGGRATLVGLPHRSIAGPRGMLIEIARPFAVTMPAPPVARLHRVPLRSLVTPFVAAGVAGGGPSGVTAAGEGRLQPVVGVRFDLWGPVTRVEAGWAPRTGGFGVTFDAHPDWWPVL